MKTGTQHCFASDIFFYLVCPLEDAVHFVNLSWKCTYRPPEAWFSFDSVKLLAIKLTRLSIISQLLSTCPHFLYHA